MCGRNRTVRPVRNAGKRDSRQHRLILRDCTQGCGRAPHARYVARRHSEERAWWLVELQRISRYEAPVQVGRNARLQTLRLHRYPLSCVHRVRHVPQHNSAVRAPQHHYCRSRSGSRWVQFTEIDSGEYKVVKDSGRIPVDVSRFGCQLSSSAKTRCQVLSNRHQIYASWTGNRVAALERDLV